MNGIRVWAGVFVVVMSIHAIGHAGEEPPPFFPPPVLPTEVETIPPVNLTPGTKAKPAQEKAESQFTVTGGDELVNRVIQNEAEHLRKALAEKWLGKPLPAWDRPGQIKIEITVKKPTGMTTFTFQDGQPKLRSLKMTVTGSLEEILRNLLPHEVMHCVLAAHFGQPLPRWIDEGIAILAESEDEQARQEKLCRDLLTGGKAIVLRRLLPMTEYPKGMMLYAQGHSVVRFLHARDPKELVPLIEAGLKGDWDKALKATYGFADADELEAAWIEWLRKAEVHRKLVKPAAPAEYKIEPPDVLLLAFDPKPEGLPENNHYRVRPDGTIRLGKFGSVSVTGKKLPVIAHDLLAFLDSKGHRVQVTVDVSEYNSKAYWVITDGGGQGERVIELPITGKETVLTAIARIGGLSDVSSKRRIWIARRTPNADKDQILPVDWKGITKDGQSRTNYQLLPGDRVYIKLAK